MQKYYDAEIDKRLLFSVVAKIRSIASMDAKKNAFKFQDYEKIL